MTEVVIRSEHDGDQNAIRQLIDAAFANTPHGSGSESAIVAALRHGDALAVSLVAERQGELLGHVAISPVSISDGSTAWFGLGPIAVVPDQQRQGIGSALMNRALADLRQIGARGCVLLGEPGYYRRFGFDAVPGLVLPGFPAEYFLALKFGDAFPHGSVTYHPAFSAVGEAE